MDLLKRDLLTDLLGPPPAEPPRIWITTRFIAARRRAAARSSSARALPLVLAGLWALAIVLGPRLNLPALVGDVVLLALIALAATSLERQRRHLVRRVTRRLGHARARDTTPEFRRPEHWGDAWVAAFIWTPWLGTALVLTLCTPYFTFSIIQYSGQVPGSVFFLIYAYPLFLLVLLPLVLLVRRRQLRFG